jgi:cytosine/adenosine deaminase-related metal-dependent hydrolase
VTRIVLRGARHPGDIVIEDGVVSAIGAGAFAAPGDHVVACEGEIVTPGLVNTHHHLYQWLTRGRATSCDLFGWLTELYPVWGRLRPADAGIAARRGIAELALSGVTTVFDHHYVVPGGDDSVFDEIADAAGAIGCRLYLGRGSMDLGESRGGLPPDTIVEETGAILDSTEAVVKRLASERVRVVVAPCSPFTVTPELMRSSAELARSLGLRLHTHLAETVSEGADSLDRFGKRPLDFAEELGWLGSDVWFAHGIHFDAGEISRIGAAGTGVAHCPRSNARLGAGMCHVRELLDAGAPVGLGVDGPSSNETGELFGEMRQALYTARQLSGRPGDLSPAEALALGTEGGAACLGRDDLGRVEVGLPADLAVWPAADLGDIANALDGLVLGPDRRVRHLFVGGQPVVEDGNLVRADIGALREQAIKTARGLWE